MVAALLLAFAAAWLILLCSLLVLFHAGGRDEKQRPARSLSSPAQGPAGQFTEEG